MAIGPLYPLTFHPIFKERVWGGRRLQDLYDKALPPHVPVGESWEISDRPGDVSVIANGALAGIDLHWLAQNRASELMGSARLYKDRFPFLVKILDARETLSAGNLRPSSGSSLTPRQMPRYLSGSKQVVPEKNLCRKFTPEPWQAACTACACMPATLCSYRAAEFTLWAPAL
jgi:hypothetical protein